MKRKPTVSQIIKDAMAKRGVKDTYQYVRKSMSRQGFSLVDVFLCTKGVLVARRYAYQMMLAIYLR